MAATLMPMAEELRSLMKENREEASRLKQHLHNQRQAATKARKEKAALEDAKKDKKNNKDKEARKQISKRASNVSLMDLQSPGRKTSSSSTSSTSSTPNTPRHSNSSKKSSLAQSTSTRGPPSSSSSSSSPSQSSTGVTTSAASLKTTGPATSTDKKLRGVQTTSTATVTASSDKVATTTSGSSTPSSAAPSPVTAAEATAVVADISSSSGNVSVNKKKRHSAQVPLDGVAEGRKRAASTASASPPASPIGDLTRLEMEKERKDKEKAKERDTEMATESGGASTNDAMIISTELGAISRYTSQMKGFDRELMEREAEFVRRLVEQMESNSNEYSALVKSNEVIDDIFKLIKYLIYKEVETSASVEVLFRSDSTCTNLMKVYARIEGLSYLYKTLEPLIYHLATNPHNYQIQQKNKKEVKKSIEKLAVTCQLFVDTIISSLPDCPPRLRKICRLMRKAAERKWPDASTSFAYIGGFIFLRLFCPAIVAPSKYKLIGGAELSAGGPEMARTFILITKTLQKAANNSTFEKGQDLFPMNSFITTNHKEIDRFFASISAK